MGKASVRHFGVLFGLAVALVLAAIFSLKTGQVPVSWSELWHILFESRGAEEGTELIVMGLRLPRMLLGIAVGASLAVSGTVFQAILRNPLADPYLLGLAGGAALGAAGMMLTGAGDAHILLVPSAAFLGALGALFAVTRVAAVSGSPGPTTLILAGVMVSAFCTAMVMLLNAISPSARVHGALLWMMGSLASPPPGILPLVLGVAAAGAVYLSFSGHHLNALSLGEDAAKQVGVDVGKVRTRFLVAASLITGVSVAASGLIGFIGLVIPHALRNLIGADHRLLVPASALAGGAVLILADSGARTILAPAEIPVGVITALFGAPFFLVLLRRRQGWMK